MPIQVLDMPDLNELPELPEDVAALRRRPLVADELEWRPTAYFVPTTTVRCTPAIAVEQLLRRRRDGTV
jgi:hypothetical protein